MQASQAVDDLSLEESAQHSRQSAVKQPSQLLQAYQPHGVVPTASVRARWLRHPLCNAPGQRQRQQGCLEDKQLRNNATHAGLDDDAGRHPCIKSNSK